MTSDAVILADIEKLGRVFDLRFQLTVQPLQVVDLPRVAESTLLPHFVIQGRVEHARWRKWLPSEIAVTQTSLLLIMHFEWGRFVCTARRGDQGSRSIRLERLARDRKIARADRGRYISNLIVPFLNGSYSAEIAETRRVEVNDERMHLEIYCDKFDECLSLAEKHSGVIDYQALFDLLLRGVEDPNGMSVSLKSDVDCIEQWVTLGYCSAAPDFDPYLSYQSEAGTTLQDLLPASVPLILDAIRGPWRDKEVAVSALLLRRRGVRMLDSRGIFQMTHEPGGAPPVSGRVIIFDELSHEEAEALKAVGAPVVKDVPR